MATHTPMSNWSDGAYNPGWVYISGHTHQNGLVRGEDGTCALFDDQVGYEPRPWHFNAFTRCARYDPFESWGDGIYDISAEQYKDFSSGRGIAMEGFRWKGGLRVVKRAETYMFFLEQKSLSVLAGGQRKRAEHGIEYYYDNLLLYRQRVEEAFGPYRAALDKISKEVRAFGGAGTVHGCIVDVDYSNHIYLNPFDGKVTPYFAWDMAEKTVYPDVGSMLRLSPAPPRLPSGETMSKSYRLAEDSGKVPTLSTVRREGALATVPEFVLDRSMYEPSRIMRSAQYIFDQDVVRVWNDEILDRGCRRRGGAPKNLQVEPAKLPK